MYIFQYCCDNFVYLAILQCGFAVDCTGWHVVALPGQNCCQGSSLALLAATGCDWKRVWETDRFKHTCHRRDQCQELWQGLWDWLPGPCLGPNRVQNLTNLLVVATDRESTSNDGSTGGIYSGVLARTALWRPIQAQRHRCAGPATEVHSRESPRTSHKLQRQLVQRLVPQSKKGSILWLAMAAVAEDMMLKWARWSLVNTLLYTLLKCAELELRNIHKMSWYVCNAVLY